MKKYILKIVGLFIILLFGLWSVVAQLSTHELPYSFQYRNIAPTKNILKLQVPDMQRAHKEDQENERKGGLLRIAVPILVNLDIERDGEWIKLPDGGSLWRLTVAAKGAKSLNCIFSQFWLPRGGKFFVYNRKTRQSIGAITDEFLESSKEHPDGFSTAPVEGEQLTLEYYQPAYLKKQKPIIKINDVRYGYKLIASHKAKSLGASLGCQININCTEGGYWQKEKNAVAKVILRLYNGDFLGTGALVNNTKDDCKPYFLTANHNLHGFYDAEGNSNLTNFIFYWNYEYTSCNGSGVSNISSNFEVTIGATLVANNPLTDFALLELKQDPRNHPNLNLHYLGWDRTGTSSSGGVSIHHPRGDIKKISLSNKQIVTNSSQEVVKGIPYPPNRLWKVNFYKGTTEKSSSGCPLLNSNHKVIGQLVGGTGQCPPLAESLYGRFDVSWTANNNPKNYRRLDHWLDPNGTGTTVLEGKSRYEISGSNTICDQETYTIENLPSSATVLWSTSNTKLQLLSGQGTGTAVFKKNSSGESIIKAKIMVNGSVVANLETKTITCGTPFSNSISVDIFGQFNDELFNPSPQNYICMDSPNLLVVKYKNSDPELYNISEAEWNILEEGSLWYFEPYFPSGTSYDYPFDIIFTDGQNSAYPPPFTVRLRNKCGWSAPIPLQFMVKNCNNNLSYFLSPNGDGINDIWEPYKPTRKGKSPSFNVGVFNKKGDVVYQKDNYMQDKERFFGVGNYGKYNGKTLPAGDYFFTITGSIAASGHIYIKRE